MIRHTDEKFLAAREALHKLAYSPEIAEYPERAVAIGEVSTRLQELAREVRR